MAQLPLIQIAVYSLTLWFGLYLLARDFQKPGLRYAGLGLVSYALGLGLVVIFREQITDTTWLAIPLMFPAVFWMGATFYLVPDVPVSRVNVNAILIMLGAVIVVIVLALVAPMLAQWLMLVIPAAFLVGAAIRLRQAFATALPRRPLVLLVTATLFFGLSAGLIILPLSLLPQDWVLLAISLDILLLGYTVAVLDAYDEGTTLLPDALRSLTAAALGALVFGGQVVMVMAITDNTTRPMILLLFGMITTLLMAQAFLDRLQSLLDGAIFSGTKMVRFERDQLRAVSSAVTRVDESRQFQAMGEDEFARITRRAISHYGDLNKLASSPLIRLPLIENRLQEAQQDDNVLARAHELKSLLRESIEYLKPEGDADFAASDEWRYYNVLYFPYIVGIKPYSRRYYHDDLHPSAEEALDWFQTYVPERTLYNWQNTAAQLVAQHLREKMA